MNNNNSSPSSPPTTSNNAPSEILHRIASYLSINDAESMSVGGSYYSLSNRTAPQSQSRQSSPQYPSSQHSLDYVYQSSNRSRVSPLAANTPRHAHPTNNNNNSNSTINNNNRENNLDSPYNNQDEEDWFVGGQHSINSSLGGCGTSLSLGGGATPHPGFVTLMPLEEEFDNNNNGNVGSENVVQGNNNAGGANLSSKLLIHYMHFCLP